MTDDLDNLSPDKLKAAIERLEAEKRRRAEGKPTTPEAPTAVARHVVDPASNPIINRPAPPASPRQAERRAAKPRKARLTPTHFIIQTAKPMNGDCGSIAEGYFIVQDGKVFLSDASGMPKGEGHTILRDAPYTARQALRERLAARRGSGPHHDPIRYPPTGWR
jgi:hypothetical protein